MTTRPFIKCVQTSAAAPDFNESPSFRAREARRDIIDALLEAGADVHAKTNSGMTPLIFAQSIDNDDLVVDKLIKAGVNPNERDVEGKTAEDYASDTRKFIRTGALKLVVSDGFVTITKERKKKAIKDMVESEK